MPDLIANIHGMRPGHCYKLLLVSAFVAGLGLGGCSQNSSDAAGAKQDTGPKYALEMDTELTLGPSEERPLGFVLRAKDGYIIKKETPFSATFASSGGAKIGKAEMGKEDVRYSEGSRIEGENLVTSSGAGKVDASFVFFVCDDTLCERFTAEHSVRVRGNGT